MATKFLYKLAAMTAGAALSFGVIEARDIRLVQAADLSFNFSVSDYIFDDQTQQYILQNAQSGTYSVDQNSFNTALAKSTPEPVGIPIIGGGSLLFFPAGTYFAGSYLNISLGSINRDFLEVSDRLSAPEFGEIGPGSAINCGIATCGATYFARLSGETVYRQTPVPEPSEVSGILFFSVGLLILTRAKIG